MLKEIGSVLLIASMFLVLVPQIYDYSKIPKGTDFDLTRNELASEIAGRGCFFFVVLCIIWLIPEVAFSEERKTTGEQITRERPREDLNDFLNPSNHSTTRRRPRTRKSQSGLYNPPFPSIHLDFKEETEESEKQE